VRSFFSFSNFFPRFYFLEQARDDYDVDPASDLALNRTPPTPGLLSSLHPSQLLSSTRLRLIASMFAQMCEAMATCHGASVFHWDIKPENFIVTDGSSSFPTLVSPRATLSYLTWIAEALCT
jgi:serine/threonine protein kinase